MISLKHNTMKIAYKNFLGAASGMLLSVCLALPATAQHTSSGGGGGSSHSSGGGGGSAPASRPSGGGGSPSRPSSGGSGAARPGSSGVGSRGASPQKATYVYRNGAIVRNTNTAPGVRGNYGYPQRVGAANATSGYRTAPRIGNSGYWSSHSYYYNTHGYYKTYYMGRLGYTCRVLPYGYYPFFWGDYQYFFCDGLFYTYADDEYTVVEPPVGAEVTSLPDNAQSIVINGQQYYECNGVYYLPVTKDNGSTVYEVAGKDGVLNTTDSTVQDAQPQAPQIGDIVTQLPPNCRKLKINGDKLYVSPDGVYYKEQVDPSGNKTYKIVGLPSDDNTQGGTSGQ